MRTQYTNPAIHQAFNILEQLSADEKTRQRAEQRKKALRNEASLMNGAFREGWKGGKEEKESKETSWQNVRKRGREYPKKLFV